MGEAGVTACLDIIRKELDITMALLRPARHQGRRQPHHRAALNRRQAAIAASKRVAQALGLSVAVNSNMGHGRVARSHLTHIWKFQTGTDLW
jgi:hypothetical protein